MAAIKTQSSVVATPQYHVTSAAGNHVVFQQELGTGNVTLGTASSYVTLSRQNVIDLLPSLTAFANTGVIP